MKKVPSSKFQVLSPRLKNKAKKIKLLILDVDGVMTDGSIILDSQDNEIKAFHVRDGHGIKMAQGVGIEIAIISGRESRVVERRALELAIKEVYQKALNKIDVYEKMLKKFGLKDDEVAYIGDDINDMPLLKRVGLSIAVADADKRVKEIVDYVTEIDGGRGAVREVIDVILKAQGKLFRI